MRSDPYTVLGVATDSGPAEWKRAYRRLARMLHPDLHPGIDDDRKRHLEARLPSPGDALASRPQR